MNNQRSEHWSSIRKAMMALAIMASAVVMPSSTAAAAPESQSAPSNCTSILLPVTLASDQTASHTIAGTLCRPRGHDADGDTVDILAHGASYAAGYWNMPNRSYVDRTIRAKHGARAVFYYDRLGVGRSSKLNSTLATIDTDAHVLHQVIQWLRHDRHFNRVNLIGHSFGSMISIAEVGRYHDVNLLVLTGLLHSTGQALISGAIQQIPASQASSERWPASTYDSGWLTTPPPASNRAVFHNLAVSQG